VAATPTTEDRTAETRSAQPARRAEQTPGAHPRGSSPAEGRRGVRRLLSSIRWRILGGFVLLLAATTIASVLLVREVVAARLDDRLDEELVQESRELSRLAERGIDPRTGEPFGGDVRRILEVFLQRNVPARNEAFLTFVGGAPYLRSRNVLPYRLDRDPALVELWADLERPDAGSVETPGGAVRYLALPILARGEVGGVFVAAAFRDLEA
jgi:two-component system OmpR family sensor kinase